MALESDAFRSSPQKQRLGYGQWSHEVAQPPARRAEALAQWGLEAYRRWDAQRALNALQQAIRLHPENADYHLHLAAAHVRFGDVDEALADLRAFLRYEDVTSPTARRIRRLLQEQEAQRQIRALRDRLHAQLAALEEQRAALDGQVAVQMAAAVEQARAEERRIRRWMQRNRLNVLKGPLIFQLSGGIVVQPGEAISEKHLAALDRAVQEYLQDIETQIERDRAQRERGLDQSRKRAEAEAERELSELQERSEAICDPVDGIFARRMREDGLSDGEIQAARHMWLEFRICIGRANIAMRKPETWAAGVDYTVRKVNFREGAEQRLARAYGVSPTAVRTRHNALVDVLDIMPCDYRYFVGKENPLDSIVEAAAMLEELERRFREPSEA